MANVKYFYVRDGEVKCDLISLEDQESMAVADNSVSEYSHLLDLRDIPVLGKGSLKLFWDNFSKHKPHTASVPGVFEYVYLSSLPSISSVLVNNQKGFFVSASSDQMSLLATRALAIYQLLSNQGKLWVLCSVKGFLVWYRQNHLDVDRLVTIS